MPIFKVRFRPLVTFRPLPFAWYETVTKIYRAKVVTFCRFGSYSIRRSIFGRWFFEHPYRVVSYASLAKGKPVIVRLS